MTGRPAAEKPRDTLVALRVMPDERAAWMRAAERADLSLSAWIRALANREAPSSPKKKGPR